MSNKISFAELFEKLKSDHLTPGGLITELSKKGEVVVGLWLYCSPLLGGDKVARVKGVVGEGFSVDFDPNKQEIRIRAKIAKTG